MPSTTRRSLLRASLALWQAPTLFAAAPVKIDDSSDKLTISNGLLAIVIDKRSGRSSYYWTGRRKVKDAYSTAALDSRFESTSYPRHNYDLHPAPLNDQIGKGRKLTVVNSGGPNPPLLQHYTVYEGKPFFLVQVEI